MKKKTVAALMAALILAMSLSACGNTSTPEAGNNSDLIRIEELEQRIGELESEIKELKAQLDISGSIDGSQQPDNETDSLLQATIASPETSGVCGANLTWYYQNGVLAITGTGEMTDYDTYWDKNDGDSKVDTPWYNLKDKIGWVIIDDGVTSIGNYAFYKLPTLSKVVVSDTLISIGERAFYECGNLMELTFPASLKSISEDGFYACYNIKELTFKCSIPEGIDMIWTLGYGSDRAEAAAEGGYEPTEEEKLRNKGESHLHPMRVYYTGDTYDEYINSYPYWGDYGVEWIKQ